MNHAATPAKARHTIATIGPGGTIAPAPVARANGTPGADGKSVYDALTDLFLGDGCLAPRATADAPAEAAPRAAALPTVEGLILGHLPVLASAWVGQYAKHVARELGHPVGLLRARAGSVALDLVGAAPDEQNAEPSATLEEAVDEATSRTDRWIISAEAISEPRIAAMLGGPIDVLTLLTGADEAAVVACYKTIKSLLGKPHEREEADEEARQAQVQLGVMGAPQDKAEEAGEKLALAAETFLGRRARIVACVSKIGGTGLRALYRGGDARSIDDLIEIVRQRSAQRPRPTPSPAKPKPDLASILPPKNLPEPAATTGRIGLPVQSSMAKGERAGSLAAHVAGLTGIPFRCPYTARVELAKSSDGRLHLLARADDPHGLGTAAAHLAGTSAWARAHADLLMAACPGLALTEDSGPLSHVFTERAPEARSLLDSEIRVHLLTEARLNGSSTWVCVELN